jgi:ribosome-associated toxin RatA of RatAB toxin-antitoxin module
MDKKTMSLQHTDQDKGFTISLIRMNTTRIRPVCLACLITFILLIPTAHCASDYISLSDREKKLIGQGEIIVREVDTAGKDGRTFEAIGLINASRGAVFQVLADYNKYPEFMPRVSHIEIVEKSGNESIVNYTLKLPLGKIKKYRLRIYASEGKNQLSLIQWQLQKWPELKSEETIRDTTGYWRIEEKTQNSSLVLYHVYTDPGPIPFGFGWIVDILSKKSVPEVLLQTKYRTEKISQTSLPEKDINHKK